MLFIGSFKIFISSNILTISSFKENGRGDSVIEFTVPHAAVFHKSFEITPVGFVVFAVVLEHGVELVSHFLCDVR